MKKIIFFEKRRSRTGSAPYRIVQQPQPLLQPPQLALLLPPPQQQQRMMMRMMIHRQPPPKPLLHPIKKYLLNKIETFRSQPILCGGGKVVREDHIILEVVTDLRTGFVTVLSKAPVEVRYSYRVLWTVFILASME